MHKPERVNIPTIRGRILERLQRSRPREPEDLEFGDSVGEVVLKTPAERGVVALACLVLENLREAGGSNAPERTLEHVLKKALVTLGPKEIMDLEIEAYEMMLWIGAAIDPNWTTSENVDIDSLDPRAGHEELIRFAIASGQDLELDYYSANRGELTHRRITPLSFEAETYIHAYCHMRRDERIFRVSRIADLKPVGGWAKVKKHKPKKDDEPENSGQMSLI
jgi:hypothetical protein